MSKASNKSIKRCISETIINGRYVICQLKKGHKGDHEMTFRWNFP